MIQTELYSELEFNNGQIVMICPLFCNSVIYTHCGFTVIILKIAAASS